MEKTLDQIAEHLQELGFEAYIHPLDEAGTVSQVVVELEEPEELRMVIFMLGELLTLVNDKPGSQDISEQLKENKADFLQLFIRIPIAFENAAVANLARLLMMINWSTPIGAFGLYESQNFLYYRHVFECIGSEPSLELIGEAVMAMEYYAKLRFESLKVIASGEKTLEQYLQYLDQKNQLAQEFPGYDL